MAEFQTFTVDEHTRRPSSPVGVEDGERVIPLTEEERRLIGLQNNARAIQILGDNFPYERAPNLQGRHPTHINGRPVFGPVRPPNSIITADGRTVIRELRSRIIYGLPQAPADHGTAPAPTTRNRGPNAITCHPPSYVEYYYSSDEESSGEDKVFMARSGIGDQRTPEDFNYCIDNMANVN